MSDSFLFHYHGFRPRNGLEPHASGLLEHLRPLVPSNSVARASVVDTGDKYVFSIVITCKYGFFGSEQVVQKSEMVGADRLWQLEPIGRMVRDLDSQLSRWKSQKRNQTVTAPRKR